MAEEIKTSFSWKYILLLILTAIISIGGTIAYDIYKEKQQAKILNISLFDGNNQISKNYNNDAILKIKYSLKSDSSEINSYFNQSIIVTNVGNEGIEDVDVNISAKDSDIILIPTPTIETQPKELVSAINPIYKNISKSKAIISLPLLNKDETIIFTYKAYSKKYVEKLNLTVYVHKKDLKVEFKERFSKDEGKNYFDIIFSAFGGISLTVLLLTFTETFRVFVNRKKRE